MEEQRKKIKAALFLIVPVVVIIVIAILVKQLMPSKEVMELTEYYPVEENEILLVMQDEVYETRGLYIDGTAYVDYDTVVKLFNKRFYWDANENILLYTTPAEVIKTEVGSKNFYVNRSKSSVDYQIVKVVKEKAYIAVDYIKQYSNLEYEFYEKPNRMVFTYKWNQEYTSALVKKDTQLRAEASIKSPILKELTQGEEVIYIADEEAGDEEDKSDGNDNTKKDRNEDKDSDKKKSGEKKSGSFIRVITKDGITGYVKNKRLKDEKTQVLENDYEEVKYPSITKDYKINMVWHQVTVQEANDNLLNLLDATKGVNTISPTWFRVANNKGEITSLASETYVNRAHGAGVEVWALCTDVDNLDVNMLELLSYTSRREKLISELIAAAIKYNLDGLNIDFERTSKDAGPHFVQFIRELSVKCRSNGIVLSVDNYAPGYTDYYDRREQGIVADYVVTMAYDEYHGGSEESGPVSSIGYVKDAITNTLKEVPAEKTIIGIPFFTRLWKETEEDGEVKVSSEAYGMTSAANVFIDNGVEPVWDETAGLNYGEFEADGSLYRMWLEDEQSIELKMQAIEEADAAGVSGWKLNLEKASVWDVIIKYIN